VQVQPLSGAGQLSMDPLPECLRELGVE